MGNQPAAVSPTEASVDLSFVPPQNVIDTIYSRYKRVRTLGSGGSGKVIQARDKMDLSQVAIKKLNRSVDSNARVFRREFRVLRKLVHPNIVSLRGTFIDKKSYCLVTELCTGGRLLDRLKREPHLSEAKVAEIMRQLLQAVSFMHHHNIVHRDLKPENVVYDRAGPDAQLVIIDFGTAREIDNPNAIFEDFTGTIDFMAPESIRNRHAEDLKKTDMWALGVIAFILLTGRLPFYGKTRRECFIAITSRNVRWPRDVHVSQDCQHFVRHLLKRKISKRMSADEALEHDWIQFSGAQSTHDLGHQVLKHVATYKSSPQLKQVLVDMAVSEMQDEHKSVLSLAFREIMKSEESTPRNGFDEETLRKFLESTGMSAETASCRAQSFFQRFGSGSGRITFEEFLRMHVAHEMSDNDFLHGLFDRLDEDHDGRISSADLQITLERLGKGSSEDVAQTAIDECSMDWSEDKRYLSFDEFAHVMKKLDSNPCPDDASAEDLTVDYEWTEEEM